MRFAVMRASRDARNALRVAGNPQVMKSGDGCMSFKKEIATVTATFAVWAVSNLADVFSENGG